MPGLRRDLGDAGTHDAGADDEDDGVGAQIERHGRATGSEAAASGFAIAELIAARRFRDAAAAGP